jgi:hypothetical protein
MKLLKHPIIVVSPVLVLFSYWRAKSDLRTSCLMASKWRCLEASDILEVYENFSYEEVCNYDSGSDADIYDSEECHFRKELRR